MHSYSSIAASNDRETTGNTLQIEARLLALVHKEFPLAKALDLQVDQNMLESGAIDSLGLLTIIDLVQTQFAIEVSDLDVTMENFGSVSNLARYIISKGFRSA